MSEEKQVPSDAGIPAGDPNPQRVDPESQMPSTPSGQPPQGDAHENDSAPRASAGDGPADDSQGTSTEQPAAAQPEAAPDAVPGSSAAAPAESGAPVDADPQDAGRQSGPLAARKKPTVVPKFANDPQRPGGQQPRKGKRKDAPAGEAQEQPTAGKAGSSSAAPANRGPVNVPSKRAPLEDDLEAEIQAALAATDLDSLVNTGMSQRQASLEEGQQVHAQVIKTDADNVFVSLGGPHEGMVPVAQFEEVPEPGASVEVVVRGYSSEDGLYVLVLPGQALDVSDWEDLEEGTIVEAHATAANSGGLEVTVGNMRGFIPISQISEHRVDDASDFVGQRLQCVVTEVNPRRKNLVLSRRAILEREREQKRQEQLEQIEAGQTLEGTVRSLKEFGAFIDLGGLEGLIHISKLSWDRVKDPAEVLEVGQKVKVKVDKVDKQTGKISLSYRDLLEHPWDNVDAEFAVGSVRRGTVTRIADFGAFVRLAPGIEGLVHISELAHHRVSKVGSYVKEGEEVDVKVLSIDRDAQRMSLSIKAAQAQAGSEDAGAAEEVDEPPREPAVKPQYGGPLRGGTGRSSGGEQFGLRF